MLHASKGFNFRQTVGSSLAFPHGDDFFFEIVERCGGYSDYDALNAQFRITAQKRELPPKRYAGAAKDMPRKELEIGNWQADCRRV